MLLTHIHLLQRKFHVNPSHTHCYKFEAFQDYVIKVKFYVCLFLNCRFFSLYVRAKSGVYIYLFEDFFCFHIEIVSL